MTWEWYTTPSRTQRGAAPKATDARRCNRGLLHSGQGAELEEIIARFDLFDLFDLKAALALAQTTELGLLVVVWHQWPCLALYAHAG